MTVCQMMPHDLELEKSVLAGCILHRDDLCESRDFLRAEDFYRSAHQIIFATMSKMLDNKEPTDAAALGATLREDGNIELVGGPSYLFEILDTPYPSSMKHFTRMIRGLAARRWLIKTCADVSKTAYDTRNDTHELINTAQKLIMDVDGSDCDSICTMYDLTNYSIDRYRDAREGRDKTAVVKTGFPKIDELTGGGFRPNKFIIIAARPGIGKTALMQNMAANMAKNGDMVGVFSLEMDKESIDDRWMASESGVNSLKLINGMNDSDWQRVMRVAEKKSSWPILVDDSGNLPVYELKRRGRKMVQMGARILFIDQASKLKGDNRKTIFENITQNVIDVGAMKKELHVPIVLLAQINRDSEKTVTKKPTLANLKNTGAFEEEADIILLGHRDYPYTKLEADQRKAEWEIAKNRGGPVGNVGMDWDAKRTTFTEEGN